MKFIKKKGSLLILLLLVLTAPVFARSVIIKNNIVYVVPGVLADTAGNGAMGRFTDTFQGEIDPPRSLKDGALWMTAFNIHDEPIAGMLYLDLVAMDAGTPAGQKQRIKRLSESYTNQTTPIFYNVNVAMLDTIIDSPPPPIITANQSGYDLNFYPIMSIDIELQSNSAPYNGVYDQKYYPCKGFHYEIIAVNGQKYIKDTDGYVLLSNGNKKISVVVTKADFDAFDLPANFLSKDVPKTFTIRAYAYGKHTVGYAAVPDDGFPESPPKWAANVSLVTQIKPQDIASLDPGTITLRNGINFISMPFNRKGVEIGWYAYQEDALTPIDFNPAPNSNKIEMPRDLILAINQLAKDKNIVVDNIASTFGRWQTNDAGVLIPNKDLNQVSPAGNVILNDIVLLRSEEGYQVYISGLPLNPDGTSTTFILKIKSSL